MRLKPTPTRTVARSILKIGLLANTDLLAIFLLSFSDGKYSRYLKSLICDALRDLVPFVQFKNVKNTYGEPATLTLLHGCFSRFLNCANGTKSRNAPHIHIYLSFPLSSNQIR